MLSNPPWTSLSANFRDPLTAVCRDVFKRAGDAQAAKSYENPDITPDLPFLLRSTEWCRPGGRIAMALPARILLKQEETPRTARALAFKLLSVSGIINGFKFVGHRLCLARNEPTLHAFARDINQRPSVEECCVHLKFTPQSMTKLSASPRELDDRFEVSTTRVSALTRTSFLGSGRLMQSGLLWI